MRTQEQIKQYWEGAHEASHIGALSGCEYQATIDFLKVTDKMKEGIHVLEVGVGLGYVTKGLYEKGMRVDALDISIQALERVRQYCEFIYDLDDMILLPSNYYDIILWHNGVQHVPTDILERELEYLIRSLKDDGVFAVEFISTDLIEDTGVDSEIMDALRWDSDIGCYCRQPDYFEAMINRHGGKCNLVYDYRGNIAENINGCHIFHVTKS